MGARVLVTGLKNLPEVTGRTSLAEIFKSKIEIFEVKTEKAKKK